MCVRAPKPPPMPDIPPPPIPAPPVVQTAKTLANPAAAGVQGGKMRRIGKRMLTIPRTINTPS